tara:strand:+ start:497 stop:637 length:141 start_codon:yes stop_codon:yes gene_type:complete
MNWQDNLKKQDISELEKIVKELEKAVEMHTSQAKRISEYIEKIKGD